MKSMLRFLNRYTKECILAPLFKMLEASFELLVPLVMASIIDVGLANNDRTVIFTRCGLLLVLALVGLVCSITAQYFSARAAVGFASGVRHALFQKLQSLTFSDHDTIGASTLITRMTGDVNQTQTGVNLALRLLLRSPFVVFGAMIMAFTIDVRCALIFVGVIALLIVVVFGLMALNIPMMRTVRQALDKVLGATRETLGGARVLRAFCMEDSDYKAFVDKNRTLTEAQKRAGRVSGLMNPLTYLLINFAIVYLIHTGAVRVSLGALTPGMVVALYNYMSQILVELIKMANLIVSLNKAAACWKRIENILEMKPDMQSPAKPAIWNDTDEAVRFDHVSLRYRDAGAESLTDISFTVKRGQTFGIIGGTGAGKSSVVRLIPRFYDATSGTVSVFGEDVRNHSETTLRKHIGFVLQHADLFSGTIRDNLLWGNEDATDEMLLEALESAQAKEVVERKGGLDAPITQNGGNLSGGQRQRLTIARALVRRPDILVLDDSASALDQGTDARLRRAIHRLPYHPTVFIVSQRAASVRHADQILVLDDGHMVGLGNHEKLIADCPVYREIYESQYGKGAQA